MLRPTGFFPALLAFLLLTVGSGCDGLPNEIETSGNVVERLDRDRDFETFSEVLSQTGLASTLASGEAYTVLAPTEIAFEYLGASFLSALLAEQDVLARVIRHHVIPGRLAPEDFVDGGTLTSIDGNTLPVRRIGPVVRVGDVTLDLTEAIEAEGSVAYPIADVLLGALAIRERVELAPSLSKFRAYASEIDLLGRMEALDSATFLAPINDGIDALGNVERRLFDLSSTFPIQNRVLEAHLVPGTPDLATGQTVTSIGGDPLEIRTENGLRTIGGRRILREELLADGRLLVLGGVVLETITIAQRMQIETSLLLYWQELRDAVPDLWERLQDENESLTAFAPTDIGYQLRGAALNNALTDPVHEELNKRVLMVHIVEGEYLSESLVDGLQLQSVDGTVLAINTDAQRTVYLEGRRLGVNVVARRASNGVVYTLNSFVRPAVDALDSALLQGFIQHVEAVFRAGLDDTFRMPGLTAFIASDSLYLNADDIRLTPGPFLRFNATESSIPSLIATGFFALDGTPRVIRYVECPDGSDPKMPEDRDCSPYQFENGVQIYKGSTSGDGTGYLHSMRTLSRPPSASGAAPAEGAARGRRAVR